MPLTRAQKTAAITDLNDDVAGAEIMVVTQPTGLNATQVFDLRRKMLAAGVTYRVFKNTLGRRALAGTRFAEVQQLLKGPTALAYGKDPVATAKAAVEFAKANDKMKIIGAVFGGKVLDEAATKALASLPPLEVVRAKLAGLLQTPAQRIASILQAPAGQVARVIGAYARKDS